MRFPFLTAPIAFSLWFGLGMLAATDFVDRRTREDYAFWGYLFGLIGVLVIFGGVKFQRQQARIESAIKGLVPDSVRHLLPTERRPRG